MNHDKLVDLFDFLPKSKNQAGEGIEDGKYPFYTSSANQTKYLNKYQYEPGCLVFGTGGKASIHFANTRFSTSTDCIILQPKPNSKINSLYVFHYFKNNMQILEKGFKGVGLKHISKSYLSDIQIPYPKDINDQIRIAHLLSNINAIIIQRENQLQQIDILLESIFFKMFGDPVLNDKKWATIPFDRIGKFTGGGTPSKTREDFWSEDFPWVSPKDMKVSKIYDAEDHISKKVFEETSLKRISPGQLLIVVRGMILAHSFPTAINMVEISINQDMKAIKPVKDINVIYLQNCLFALKRQILKLVSTTGHGTRKFDSSAMQKLLIPKPPKPLQNYFAEVTDNVERIKSLYRENLNCLKTLYNSLSWQAFTGKISLLHIPLPALTPIEPSPTVNTSLPHRNVTFLDLPDPSTLRTMLGSHDMRNNLVISWLKDYHSLLRSNDFYLENFMDMAHASVTEQYPEIDFDWEIEDYDCMKKWVFEALDTGKLSQFFDDTENQIQLKFTQI